jgi:hypothetical protein
MSAAQTSLARRHGGADPGDAGRSGFAIPVNMLIRLAARWPPAPDFLRRRCGELAAKSGQPADWQGLSRQTV